MEYMLLIYEDENTRSDAARNECYVESASLIEDLKVKGTFVAAAPLHSVSSATSIRVRGGKRSVTDGPFAETREQLGGYYIVNVDNLDQAVAIAERIPVARTGTVEIRPIVQLGKTSG